MEAANSSTANESTKKGNCFGKTCVKQLLEPRVTIGAQAWRDKGHCRVFGCGGCIGIFPCGRQGCPRACEKMDPFNSAFVELGQGHRDTGVKMLQKAWLDGLTEKEGVTGELVEMPTYRKDDYEDQHQQSGTVVQARTVPAVTFTPAEIKHPNVVLIYNHNASALHLPREQGGVLNYTAKMAKILGVKIISPVWPGYPGRGDDAEIPQHEDYMEMMDDTYNYVAQEMKTDPSNIVLSGYCMGASIAVQWASERKKPIAGLYLNALMDIGNIKDCSSCFAGCDSCLGATVCRPCGRNVKIDRYATAKQLEDIHVNNLLVTHPKKDEIFPFKAMKKSVSKFEAKHPSASYAKIVQSRKGHQEATHAFKVDELGGAEIRESFNEFLLSVRHDAARDAEEKAQRLDIANHFNPTPTADTSEALQLVKANQPASSASSMQRFAIMGVPMLFPVALGLCYFLLRARESSLGWLPLGRYMDEAPDYQFVIRRPLPSTPSFPSSSSSSSSSSALAVSSFSSSSSASSSSRASPPSSSFGICSVDLPFWKSAIESRMGWVSASSVLVRYHRAFHALQVCYDEKSSFRQSLGNLSGWVKRKPVRRNVYFPVPSECMYSSAIARAAVLDNGTFCKAPADWGEMLGKAGGEILSSQQQKQQRNGATAIGRPPTAANRKRTRKFNLVDNKNGEALEKQPDKLTANRNLKKMKKNALAVHTLRVLLAATPVGWTRVEIKTTNPSRAFHSKQVANFVQMLPDNAGVLQSLREYPGWASVSECVFGALVNCKGVPWIETSASSGFFRAVTRPDLLRDSSPSGLRLGSALPAHWLPHTASARANPQNAIPEHCLLTPRKFVVGYRRRLTLDQAAAIKPDLHNPLIPETNTGRLSLASCILLALRPPFVTLLK
eukprot:GHVT01076395.1.p1 GENE.GHVT01076395.1~~GHVT01076395.1.p1  ORF type:complete len:924 (-),score=214.89 GHVT01076395.1:401-3085(-)